MVTYKKLEKGTFNGVNVIEYSMKNEALEVRFLNTMSDYFLIQVLEKKDTPLSFQKMLYLIMPSYQTFLYHDTLKYYHFQK